jgi:pimeloyl-ACP methyl ester carboxylesterase
MRVAEIRPEGDETVLFLHGGSVAGWMWTTQAEALPHHHALIPDLPGFGDSADVPRTDLTAVADDLAGIVRDRARDGRAHIVGLSLGGVLDAPLLALAGEREPRVVRTALVDIAGPAPRGSAAIVPAMHHVWSAEDPELFHRVLAHWLEHGRPSPELTPFAVR